MVGKVDPWPPELWVSAPGIHFAATTNKGSLQVIVDAKASVGPHFVRSFNDEGASAPRFLIVTAEASGAEVEPNDLFTQPQAVTNLPVTLNGRLEKAGDVDSFGVALEAGQTLRASLEAYTLMSPLDAVLRLVDARGVNLASNHDDGRSLDPVLVWTAPSKGVYVLQAFGFDYPAGSDVKFAGNTKCVYRLHLERGPSLAYTLPLGVQRGARTSLSLYPSNGRPEDPATMVFDGTGLAADAPVARWQAPGFVNSISLPVVDGPEAVEQESKNPGGENPPLPIPGAVSGVIDPAGDVDRFPFVARAGELWLIEVKSSALGFPLDPWLRIDDGAGKELAKNDDADSPDPRLEWTAPSGTNFVAVVGGLGRQGGRDHLYRLSFSRPTPTVKAVAPENAFVLEAGKTNEIKLTVTRRYGLTNPLTVSVTGLPAGVQFDPVTVSDKGGETLLKLSASTNAAVSRAPFRINVLDSITRREYPVVMELVSGGENNGVPQGFRRLALDAIRDLWLTVRPAPKPAEAKPPEKKS